MERIYAVIGLLLMIGQLLFLPLSLSTANANEQPIRVEEKKNKIVLSSDVMTAEFEGMKPKVKFYFTQLAEDAENYSLSFFVNFKKIVEFHDKNNDEVYQPNEKVILFEIESAKWSNETLPVMSNGKCIGFAINFTTIHLPKGQKVPIIVSLIASMYNVTNLTGSGDRLGAEVKVNVTISSWPWKGEENKLAMETRFQIHNVANLPGNETIEFKIIEEEECRQANVMIGEQPVAFLQFLRRASDDSRPINVTHSFTPKGNVLTVWTCYDHFQGTLVDDPSFGVFEEALSSIRNLLYPLLNRYVFAGAVLATIVVFAVAYKIRRKEIFGVPANV